MPIITRKIELKIVRLTDEEYDQQWKYLYQINNTIYQAANRISTHCLFNDEYEMRLRLHMPRYKEIDEGLENIKTELEKLNTKKKASDKEKRDRLLNEQRKLVDERKELDKDVKNKKKDFPVFQTEFHISIGIERISKVYTSRDIDRFKPICAK